MKIQCQRCKEIVELEQFRSSEAGVDITCAACGEAFFVPAPAAAEAGDGDSAGDDPAATSAGPRMRCPKCDDEQPEADACRACGLAADRFADFDARADESSPELALLWQACVDDWDRDAAHDRFVQAVAADFAYTFGARRYRQRLRDRPNDALARSGLDRLTRMAEATLLSSAAARKAVEPDEPYKNVVLLMVALVALVGLGGVYLLLRGRSSDSAPKAPAIHAPASPGHRLPATHRSP